MMIAEDHPGLLDVEQAAELQRLLVGLGRGLAYIHERDVIHRDIKPSNILVTDGGEARICDFGIARQLQTSASGSEVTYTGQQGSPRYMAPEVIRSERYSNKVDMYSFAITMYECWTGGQDPYEGLSAFEIMEGVSRRGLRPAVPLPLPTSIAGGGTSPSGEPPTELLGPLALPLALLPHLHGRWPHQDARRQLLAGQDVPALSL